MNLYKEYDTKEKVEEMSKAAEFDMITDLIEAWEGDIQNFGQVCDVIFFKNQSSICTLFSALGSGKISLSSVYGEENTRYAKTKFLKDIKRLFECLFTVAWSDEKLDEFIFKYDIHILLFSLMCPDFTLIKKFFNFNESIKFIEGSVLNSIMKLSSKTEIVPNLDPLFMVAKSNIEKRFQVKLPEDNIIHLTNFPFSPNPILKQMGSLYDSLSFKQSKTTDLLTPKKIQRYRETYQFSIEEKGVQVNISKLFKLFYQTAYKDSTGLQSLMDILIPLYQDISGAFAVLKIALILARDKKDKIYYFMNELVKLIIIGMITKQAEATMQFKDIDVDDVQVNQEEIDKIAESFNFSDKLVSGVVHWIRGAILLLNK
jgi:hypothetical protein